MSKRQPIQEPRAKEWLDMGDFRNPTQSEIVQILRDHPLVKLRERVTQAFVVGSFAMEQMGVGQTNADSDVDVLLEVMPRKGRDLTDLALEDQYRQALRSHFMKHGIRGKMDSVHPQWMGRRVDLYLTYDVQKEARPKVKLSAEVPADAPAGVAPDRPRQRG